MSMRPALRLYWRVHYNMYLVLRLCVATLLYTNVTVHVLATGLVRVLVLSCIRVLIRELVVARVRVLVLVVILQW